MRSLLLILLLAGAVAAVYVLLTGARQRAVAELRTRLRERELLVEHLRELAWDHRDVSPELATIILDEIRTAERRNRGGELGH